MRSLLDRHGRGSGGGRPRRAIRKREEDGEPCRTGFQRHCCRRECIRCQKRNEEQRAQYRSISVMYILCISDLCSASLVDGYGMAGGGGGAMVWWKMIQQNHLSTTVASASRRRPRKKPLHSVVCRYLSGHDNNTIELMNCL